MLYELPTSSQWCFDIQWCPRNPAVLSAAGFDGHIDIYSIMGGSSQAQSQRHADQVTLNLLKKKHLFLTGNSEPLHSIIIQGPMKNAKLFKCVQQSITF